MFGLTPFEIEMQRRLWWHISILDTRAAEDHSTDPSFAEQFYNKKLPLNINDDDISPASKEAPEGRLDTIEMIFCLIRYELSVTTRKSNFVPPGGTPCRIEAAMRTLEEKHEIIEACHQCVEASHLQHCEEEPRNRGANPAHR